MGMRMSTLHFSQGLGYCCCFLLLSYLFIYISLYADKQKYPPPLRGIKGSWRAGVSGQPLGHIPDLTPWPCVSV